MKRVYEGAQVKMTTPTGYDSIPPDFIEELMERWRREEGRPAGSITVSEAAAKMGVTYNAAARLVKKALAAGELESKQCTDGGRRVTVYFPKPKEQEG